MSSPLITIIVATFNAATTLDRCLDSVSAQTYARKELIVIDGGSTDSTVDVIKQHQDKIEYWESERDRGIYHAWNKALAHANGDWMMFLGADDFIWDEHVLEKMSRTLMSVPPSIRLVYGKVAVVTRTGRIIRMEGMPWESAKPDFKNGMSIPHPGLMHRRSLFEEHGNFDESFRIIGDYEFLLRELPGGEAVFLPDITTVGFQHGGLSNSPAATQKIMNELVMARRKHGIRPSPLQSARMQFKTTACALAVRMVGEDGFRYLADAYRKATGRPTIWR